MSLTRRFARHSLGKDDRKGVGGISRNSLRGFLVDDSEEEEEEVKVKPRRSSMMQIEMEEEERYRSKKLEREAKTQAKGKVKNDQGVKLTPIVAGSRRSLSPTLRTGLEGHRSPRSPRTVQGNMEMFHVLGDSLLDYQVGLIIQLHEMNVCHNLHFGHNNGMYMGESRDSVSTCLRYLGEGFGEGKFVMSVFFDNIFQR